MPRAIEITIPLVGDAEVYMPYAEGNKVWLRRAVGRQRPTYNPVTKRWSISHSAARRVYDAATDDGRSARLTRVFRPNTEQCTGPCQSAKPETRDRCTCICGGAHHGQTSPGWTAVGNDLLVRRGSGGLITQTTSNGFS